MELLFNDGLGIQTNGVSLVGNNVCILLPLLGNLVADCDLVRMHAGSMLRSPKNCKFP